MKYTLLIIAIAVLAGAGYWYGSRAGWFTDRTPTNLPTKAELKRMEEIEESSSQQAEDAVPGVGVRPVGSLPPAAAVIPEGTTEEPTTEPGDDQGVDPDDAGEPQPLP